MSALPGNVILLYGYAVMCYYEDVDVSLSAYPSRQENNMSDSGGAILPSSEPSISGTKVKHPGYTLYLHIPDDYIECHCSYIPHAEGGGMLTSDEFAQTLKEYGVLEMIDQTAFEDFVTMAAAGRQLLSVLIASGAPPIPGRDGYFKLKATPSTILHGSDPQESGLIDMYRVQTFINVGPGDEIGRVIPALPGIPGRNIRGVPILPEPVKEFKYTLGKNIELDEDGGILRATSIGRFCQISGVFSVEDEYVVKGDVDFNIGKIDFKGVVEVRGDVLDRFDITATKGLTVAGNIGVCRIVSGGNISFCGMDGQDEGSILCGGTLHAHHIHNSVIECTGDVIVDVEVHECIIKTLGRIIVDKDTITGGVSIAQGGIEANKLGSPSGLHTSLHAGADYHYVEEISRLQEELTATQAVISEAKSLEEITELRKSSAALSEQIATLRSKTAESANAKINVKKKLHENVRIELGSTIETVQEKQTGPLTIVENLSEGGLRYIPMSSLDVKAIDIEKAFMLEKKYAQKGNKAAGI
jgi:uncharacterized protein (DUF342 family)